jgi:5-methylcytosine-specific restriction endonuclease McrA
MPTLTLISAPDPSATTALTEPRFLKLPTRLANHINDLAWGLYGPKINPCDVTPHWKEPGRCGTCGAALSADSGIDAFCGHSCARVYFVNHNWSVARYAAAHRADYSCARCGYRANIDDDPLKLFRELVVRHIQLPASGNPRSRGCHQHLSNLVTLCKSCDDSTAHPDPLPSPPPVHSQGNPHISAGIDHIIDVPGPAVSSVGPGDLAAGLCCGQDPEFWFEPINRRRAAKVCQQCPVRVRCAQFALDLQVTDGVYAGISLPGKRKPGVLRIRRDELQKLIDNAAASHQTQAGTDSDAYLDDLPDPAAELERAGA